jgi:hypothetical protein
MRRWRARRPPPPEAAMGAVLRGRGGVGRGKEWDGRREALAGRQVRLCEL